MSFRNQDTRPRSRGFTLLEMMVVIFIMGLLIPVFTGIYRAYIRTSTAASVGEQMLVVGKAGDAYIRQYKADIIAAVPILLPLGGQVANILKPTTAELTSLGLLTVSVASPYTFDGNTASFVVTAAVTPVGCLPAVCKINQVTLLSNPWLRTLDTGQPVNEEMLNLTLARMDGRGLISTVASPATLVSLNAAFTLPNPTGIAGLLAYFSGADGGLDPAYVRMGDTRDPSLAGGLTVGGTIPSSLLTLQINGAANVSNSLAVGGTSSFAGTSVFGATATFNAPVAFNDDIVLRDPGTGLVCIRLLRAGQIDVNCNGILNAKAGTFTGPFGVVKVGDTGTSYSVDSNGSIRGMQGFYSAVGSVFGANANGVRTAGSIFTIQNSAGLEAVSFEGIGNMGARQSVSTPALGLTDPVTVGQPCTGAASEVGATLVTSPATTVLRALVGGGLASCIGSKWTALAQTASPGNACSPDGISAVSSIDGRALICKSGVYIQMNDLLSSLVFMDSFRVKPGKTYPKPVCGQLGGSFGLPIPILIGQVESSPTPSFTRRVEDADSLNWLVVLQDSVGNSLTGSPGAEALLLSYCYY